MVAADRAVTGLEHAEPAEAGLGAPVALLVPLVRLEEVVTEVQQPARPQDPVQLGDQGALRVVVGHAGEHGEQEGRVVAAVRPVEPGRVGQHREAGGGLFGAGPGDQPGGDVHALDVTEAQAEQVAREPAVTAAVVEQGGRRVGPGRPDGVERMAEGLGGPRGVPVRGLVVRCRHGPMMARPG